MSKLHLTNSQIAVVLLMVATLGAIGTGGWYLAGPVVIPMLIAVAVGLMVAVQFHLARSAAVRLPAQLGNVYRQTDALINLIGLLRPRRPLPPMAGVTCTPDFANILVSLILKNRPQTVVELGSGTSTVIVGYALEQNGEGRVYSLDHLPQYAEKSRQMIADHDLEAFAEVRHTPIRTYGIQGQNWSWYDTEALRDLNAIDLLIVDGPPDRLQKEARFPALPLLASKLAANAVICLDDADRPDERNIVDRWLALFPEFERAHLPTEKGTVLLTRRTILHRAA